MSDLLKGVRSIDPEVSKILARAQLNTDSDLRSLTRQDLHELFPGPERFKLRKTIFDKVHEQKPIDVLIRELKDFIPHESFRAALTNSGVLLDYLHILKDMKTQMNHVHSFLDAHIDLLEELGKNQPKQQSDTGTSNISDYVVLQNGQTDARQRGSQHSMPGTGTWDTDRQLVTYTGQTVASQHKEPAIVMYQTVVHGKTLGAEQQLMDKVIKLDQDEVRFQSSDNGQITIVFCPISSRVESDVEAAMWDVKGDKPVILVLMHHTRQPKPTSVNTWSRYPNVEMHVNVFYHDSMNGLLTCEGNNDAVSKIQKKLLEYSPERSKDNSGNASRGSSNPGWNFSWWSKERGFHN